MDLRDNKGNRIGILGGTFNPVHLGHLILAQGAMETCDLSRVLFIPCSKPPHKPAAALISAEHRAAMLRAAIEHDPRFEFCDVEISRSGISYAVDTVAGLKETCAGDELCFIIGSDTLPELHMWKDIYRLLGMCTFLSFGRPGCNPASLKPGDLHLDSPWPERLLKNLFTPRMIEISSSNIRHRVAEGLSIRYLVPESVEMYIAEHNLYGK